MRVMQPLHDEHEELLPQLELLRMAAEAVGRGRGEVARSAVAAAYDFLANHLLPHAAAEDEVLYPVVGRILGSAHVTETMTRDHLEVERLTGLLGDLLDEFDRRGLVDDVVRSLQRTLYGLYAVVRLHFAKEEELYLPPLDQKLTAGTAAGLFAAMEQAARAAQAAQSGRAGGAGHHSPEEGQGAA